MAEWRTEGEEKERVVRRKRRIYEINQEEESEPSPREAPFLLAGSLGPQPTGKKRGGEKRGRERARAWERWEEGGEGGKKGGSPHLMHYYYRRRFLAQFLSACLLLGLMSVSHDDDGGRRKAERGKQEEEEEIPLRWLSCLVKRKSRERRERWIEDDLERVKGIYRYRERWTKEKEDGLLLSSLLLLSLPVFCTRTRKKKKEEEEEALLLPYLQLSLYQSSSSV